MKYLYGVIFFATLTAAMTFVMHERQKKMENQLNECTYTATRFSNLSRYLERQNEYYKTTVFERNDQITAIFSAAVECGCDRECVIYNQEKNMQQQ